MIDADLGARTLLIAALIEGHWDPAEFLIVPPGHQTTGVYDMDEVIRATPLAKK